MSDDDLPGDPPVVDAADNAILPPRPDTERRLANEEDTAWRVMLSTPSGRRAIWKLLQAGHSFENVFVCGPNGFPQSDATWFRAGEANMGRTLYLALARIDRAAVFAMHDENDNQFAPPAKPGRKRK